MTTAVIPVLEDAASEIQARAKKLMHRESTDFVGRMGEALMEAENAISDEDVEEYREQMIELAALAMAQAAMSKIPGNDLTR